MSIGSKKDDSSSKITIDAPPPIQQVDFQSPTGDQYTSAMHNGVETFQSQLGPQTQATVSTSLAALQSLANELQQPDAVRQAAINQRAQDFYNLQAEGINQDADLQLAKTQSDLSKRFGGAYNASFGADLMAQVQNDRLGQLADAHQQASLLGEQLAQNDEDSRLQRFNLFQNYLSGLNDQAQGVQSNSGDILSASVQQANDLAVQKANLASRLLAQNQAASDASAQRRLQTAQIAATVAMAAL
jgi:hypothetical protein